MSGGWLFNMMLSTLPNRTDNLGDEFLEQPRIPYRVPLEGWVEPPGARR
jgi:hypothetical protein